ncbi:MAG: hypothetical protein HC897_04235 [Thermoanaerobaculia bacterium]|nr:hypothetical protein [Thermoanaerobaculia bacterium]
MSRRACLHVLSLSVAMIVSTGCESTREPSTEHGERMGPPPPGYVKILGEAVPGWKSSDQLDRAPSPMGWEPMGPRPITNEFWSGTDDASGRVVSIAPHPSDPNVAYAASASGGIWKTTDAGVSWLPKTDELPNLNHGCVALDPQNPETVYAGTGEYTTQSAGDGLFRSTDGGTFWERIGTTAQVGATCTRIIVDPTDSSWIHLTGSLGYVRSTDGGASWERLLTGRASDLALDPSNPTRLYAGRHDDGLYRSTDAGGSWARLGGGLPASGVNRILVTIAASSPATVYTAQLAGSSLQGLYRSTDNGDSWAARPATPNFPSPQGWYDAFLAVDPTAPDTLYAGGVFPTYAVAGVVKSTNGGTSWTDITFDGAGNNPHPDMHTLSIGPGGALWLGCDGGVWKSTDAGAHWINANATLAVTQFYALALHPSDAEQMMAGTQDNGTTARSLGTEDWPQIFAGDGGYLAYDTSSPDRRYVTYVRLSVYRQVGGGTVNISGPWGSDPKNFIAPLVMDPNDPKTLLGGTNRVWRTTNADTTASWTAISTTSVAGGATLNAIAVAKGASGTIYTGGSNGKVAVTNDAATWFDRSTGLPAGQVSDILIDPDDPSRAYVAFHNTTGPRVLRTTDQGLGWSDVTGTLPAGVSARALEIDWRQSPPTLFVGTGVGIYWSSNDGASWTKDGADLPNVNIGDLAIDFANETIVAATYGRGAWRAQLAAPVPLFVDGFESGNTSAWSNALP